MTSLSINQSRQTLSYLVFAIVAAVSFVFWGIELKLSMAAHDEREQEVLVAYQQRQLELKSESLRDLIQELYQTGRTISLLPSIREATGGNRHSVKEDVVKQGRLSADTHRMLQQLYTNLRSFIQLSEIYFVLDGFDPDHGEVPFFMYDDQVAGTHAAAVSDGVPSEEVAKEDESFEYKEIRRQLAWFRKNAAEFKFGSEQLNAIPALISPMVRTCDNSQYPSDKTGNPKDVSGLVYSIPAYDARTGKFKGQISIIIRANVFEARLLGVPFLPILARDEARRVTEGWTMPSPSSFVLVEHTQLIEIADRRHPVLGKGLAQAKEKTGPSGRWASLKLELPSSGEWELNHYLSELEIEELVGGIRNAKHLSVAGRILLLVVLSTFLIWGFWLMRKSRRELVKMAHYDLLTDLPNRRLFFDRMETGMARATRRGSKMALFFVDVAGLNAINDRHGHHGGDMLLVKMTERLQEQLRKTDGIFCVDKKADNPSSSRRSSAPLNFMLSRLGGDEFTILCEDLQEDTDLFIVAERILSCVKEPFALGDDMIDVTLNVGAALFPDDAGDAERLLMAADSAMHECKATHSRYILFNEEMRQRAERHHTLTLELMTALQKKQFELYYQPKATLLDGRVVSMEALCRWRHPNLGVVSPVEFIPIMERNGAIVELGQWIVEQACRDLHRLTEVGFPEVRLGVNVSVRQLKHNTFHDFLKRTLEENEIEPRRLILEITETMVIEDLKKGREAMLALEKLGVSLSIDDFGSGYSSLTYLQHLPLSSLKIDKSLIDGMVDDRAIHVVESVIRLAQGLSLKTIAEGVETEDQRVLIRKLGCDMIQGYLLSRPLPLEEIIVWLNERRSAPSVQ